MVFNQYWIGGNCRRDPQNAEPGQKLNKVFLSSGG
jgi:hypothetical protein